MNTKIIDLYLNLLSDNKKLSEIKNMTDKRYLVAVWFDDNYELHFTSTASRFEFRKEFLDDSLLFLGHMRSLKELKEFLLNVIYGELTSNVDLKKTEVIKIKNKIKELK